MDDLPIPVLTLAPTCDEQRQNWIALLKRSYIMIEQDWHTYICFAIDHVMMRGGADLIRDGEELKHCIDTALDDCGNYWSWLADYQCKQGKLAYIPKSSTARQGRLKWITHMLEQLGEKHATSTT